VTLKGVGAVYQKQRKIQSGIGRIEEALEKTKGDDKAAIREVMQEVSESKTSRKSTERYMSIISDYAHEVSRCTSFAQPRSQQILLEGAKGSSSTLGVPDPNSRAKSADTSKGAKNLNVQKGSPPNKKVPANNPKHTLECWLIQIKSGYLTFLTWQLSENEVQSCGQWKLEEMAQ